MTIAEDAPEAQKEARGTSCDPAIGAGEQGRTERPAAKAAAASSEAVESPEEVRGSEPAAAGTPDQERRNGGSGSSGGHCGKKRARSEENAPRDGDVDAVDGGERCPKFRAVPSPANAAVVGTLGTISRVPALMQYQRGPRGRRGGVDAGTLGGEQMLGAIADFLAGTSVLEREKLAPPEKVV